MTVPTSLDVQISPALAAGDAAGALAALKAAGAAGDVVVTYVPTGERVAVLGAAIRRGLEEVAVWLIERGADVDRRDEADGLPPLVGACAVGATRVIEVRLARGAKVDCRAARSAGETDDTPLMTAAERGDEGLVRRLLAAGATPGLLDCRKQSAIHHALAPRPTPGHAAPRG